MENETKLLKSEKVFDGRIIDVVHDVITLPDGREAVREIVVHGGAAAIIPINDKGEIIFVRQYRHPARQNVLEIPAGTLEKDEDPLLCATRELEEETGFKAKKFEHITSMYSAIGFCTEVLHLYIATELYDGVVHLDEDEFVSVETYTLEKAVEMIFSGEIIDAKTIVAILCYKEKIDGGKNHN